MSGVAGTSAEITVIGGSGLYSLFDNAVTVTPDTPFGEPSGPVSIADIGGRRVAFLPDTAGTMSTRRTRLRTERTFTLSSNSGSDRWST